MSCLHHITSLVAIASLAGAGLAQLENMIPLLPQGGIEGYGPRLAAVWNRPSNVVSSTDWENIPTKRGLVPVACTADFGGDWLSHFKSSDMRVYDVVYDDCDQVFQLCIHKDATLLSHPTVIQNWGMVPVGMRQYAGDVVIFPNTNQPWQVNHTAQQRAPAVLFKEDYFASWSVIAHEMSHSMDQLKPGGNRWSDTPEFAKKVADDAHVVTDYAKRNYWEAFAEAGILAAYDLSSGGSLPGVQQNWTLVRNQIVFTKEKFGADLNPGAKGCASKVEGTPGMPKSDQVGQLFGLPDGFTLYPPSDPYPVRVAA